MDLPQLSKITTFVFDVDGVFTNSQLLITEDGHFLRSMNVRDGYAIKVASQQGYRLAVITGGSSKGVIERMKGLGISEIHSGVWNKIDVFKSFLAEHRLDPNEVLYIGDDLIDLEPIELAGIGVSPADGTIEARNAADHITQRGGGQGCVREVIQMVLEYQGKWLPLSK
jgi:3-deoxy-D-manno-octulosonate 8-phosphate phosphatase (KDO 8-P phosphatase)